MLSTLFTRRWLGWLALALVFAAVCTLLGRWQWHRFESRHASQTRIDRNYNASPVGIEDLLGTRAPSLQKKDQWRQVSLKGHYDTNARILVRNRPNDGNYGFEVVLPFVTDSGARVFVDRGWVSYGTDAAAIPPIPATPTGEVTVIGWLRPSEPDLHRAPIPGQIASIYVGGLGAMTQPSPYNLYVLMRTETLPDGRSPARPAALPPPDQGMSAWINFSYALQWWFGAVAGIVFVLLRARREHLDSLGIVKAPKQPKVRIWDEEDA